MFNEREKDIIYKSILEHEKLLNMILNRLNTETKVSNKDELLTEFNDQIENVKTIKNKLTNKG